MADKPVFSGAISLGGLFNIPVKAVKAVDSHDFSFHEYHTVDLSRCGRKSICKGCGADVDSNTIIKGIELVKDEIITFTKEELNNLPLNTTKLIDIDRFVEPNGITSRMVETPYFLLPQKTGEKAFKLFRDGLVSTGRYAMGKVSMRNKESICIIRPAENGSMEMDLVRYSDEMRNPPTIVEIGVDPEEAQLVAHVIDKYTKPLDLDDYTDDYKLAVEKLVEAKKNGTPVPTFQAPSTAPNMKDALRQLLGE